MNNRFFLYGIVLACLLLAGCGVSSWRDRLPWRQSKRVGATIFIHGTVGSALNVLNPFKNVPRAEREHAFGAQAMRRFRNHPLLEHDQPLLSEGLVDIPYQKILDWRAGILPQDEAKKAAYHVIGSYDVVARHINFSQDISHYALFGWSGLLSQDERKAVGFELYDALCSYREHIKEQTGEDPLIRIVAHSHGGNVALWLAEAERERKKNLKVDLLFMLGTPMQRETADCIASDVFRAILLAYSRGDKIQVADVFSTTRRKSFRRMSDITDTKEIVAQSEDKIRCDMQLLLNHDSKYINHVSMWFLGRSIKLFDFMDPLPLAVFVPTLSEGVSECRDCLSCRAFINGGEGYCALHTVGTNRRTKKSHILNGYHALHNVIVQCRDTVSSTWHPDDTSRNLIFNKKFYQALKNAFKR